MSVIIYYHGRDFDGKCSGAIAYQHYKEIGCNDIELIPIDYGKESLLDRTFNNNDIVLMLDWSASNTPDTMYRIKKEAGTFIWIDHHKTAIDNMNEAYPSIYFEGIRVVGQAGCELTWMYFNPDATMPEIVTMLGRYDVWDLNYLGGFDNLLDLQYGMKLKNWNPQDEDWKDLFEFSYLINEHVTNGKLIRKYQQGKNELTCNSSFETTVAGHKVFAVNSMDKSSQTFESLGDKYEIYCAFSFNGKVWDYSLYSTTVDVGEICKQLGGGGHKGAAGFQTKEFILTGSE
jgi:oligoribonuclease NrnB/cAMP/cGMP phosphodiesterase (DHH superfamily)